MERSGPLCHLIDGRPYHLYIDPSILRKTLQFEPQEGDLIEVTFPKCGTHWVQQIIQLILNRGESAATFMEFSRRAPILEMAGEESLGGSKSPRLIVTHLPLGRFPYRKEAKYVYVARNPWDCCASTYHFLKELPYFGKYQSFDEFVDLFMKGMTGWGDYFSHVLSGYNWRTEENVFFTTYEELKRDAPGTILKMARFLGPQHARCIEENPNVLKDVLEKSSVNYMKRIFNTSQDMVSEIFAKNSLLQRTNENNDEPKNVLFVRNGKIGGWKELFEVEHLRRFEARIEEVFRNSDIMKLWEAEWLDAKKLLNE